MTRLPGGRLGFTELFDLPVAVDIRTASRALGIHHQTAYQLIHRGVFPCAVVRVGGQYRVPTCGLMRLLGIDERPVYSVDLESDADDEEEDLDP